MTKHVGTMYFDNQKDVMRYFDKNGEEIKAGMSLRNDDGETDRVYTCEDEEGNLDLGFNASNEKWLNRYPDKNREIYPLYQFNLKEYSIVK